MGCGNALIRKLAMLTCGSKFWDELQVLMARGILVEVKHVKAHRTEKDKKDMSLFEMYVANGN